MIFSSYIDGKLRNYTFLHHENVTRFIVEREFPFYDTGHYAYDLFWCHLLSAVRNDSKV